MNNCLVSCYVQFFYVPKYFYVHKKGCDTICLFLSFNDKKLFLYVKHLNSKQLFFRYFRAINIRTWSTIKNYTWEDTFCKRLDDINIIHVLISQLIKLLNRITGNISRNGNSGTQQMNHEISRHNLDCADESAQSGMQNRLKHLDGQPISNNNVSKNNHDDIMDDDMVCLNSRSDSENSLSSMPGSDENLLNSKEELDMELQQIDKTATASPNLMSNKNEPVALDMKRARVENIVSTMRSSPGLSSNQPQVNGCKKRKLYHPQQHDNSAAERIIEHTPETQEIDDAASDIVETLPDQIKDSPDKSSSTAHSLPSSPALSPMKELSTTPKSNHNATNMLSQSPQIPKGSTVPSDLSDRLNIMRSNPNSMVPVANNDFEGLASGLADVLKSEITASLTNLVDSIVTRFIHQRRFLNKQTEAAAAAAEQLNKDLMMATQMLDRKSPRTKVSERANNIQSGMPMHLNGPPLDNNTNINMPPHVRPSPTAAMFQAPKPPQGMNSVAAAALYNSMNVLGGHPNLVNPFCKPEIREHNPEQNEALSLVVAPKKKRHKVTDTRITPRTVSRILAQDGIGPPPSSMDQCNNSNNNLKPYNPPASTPSDSPSSRSSYHAPPSSMMPVSLPTSVAIPNPSLHESQVFSPYSPFFNPHGPHGPHTPQAAQLHHMKMSSSPPGYGGMMDPRDSPPLPHPPTMLHPALLAAAHHGSSPDYAHMRAAMDANDRNSDCNSADITYEGIQPTISFSNDQYLQMQNSLTSMHSATLTPMHLRKAKLMFFWVRYPSSQVLKMYFPDIKFNKNNTAQLVKWFSNFSIASCISQTFLFFTNLKGHISYCYEKKNINFHTFMEKHSFLMIVTFEIALRYSLLYETFTLRRERTKERISHVTIVKHSKKAFVVLFNKEKKMNIIVIENQLNVNERFKTLSSIENSVKTARN
ncbi:Homeobox protein prospero [Pseudolycoriella hygida]|uniref:Homeobox protein prospero n=1 Tax=Pseudolycoriella hygida TaxID=35572 RepID=A0A9Q0MU60_9DIPT|nr:Homeobox protein prospero [Pseudolycoriella hygida]